MVAQTARRAFLRGDFQHSDLPRPPGAEGAERFEAACTQCNACTEACPEAIILTGADGFPTIDFARGGCTFCGACVEACTPQALLAGQDWPWQPRIGTHCLATQGVHCRTCEDQCDTRAIRFRLHLGGVATPELDLTACTGCGACAGPCPVNAIEMKRIQPHPREETPC